MVELRIGWRLLKVVALNQAVTGIKSRAIREAEFQKGIEVIGYWWEYAQTIEPHEFTTCKALCLANQLAGEVGIFIRN